MSAPVIPLNPEIDDLNEIDDISKTVFQQHCTEMIKDIIEHSPVVYDDLFKLKNHMTKLAESQKEIHGILHGINEMNSLIGKVNLTEEEVKSQFTKCVNEYMEGNDIDDEQREIISSVDSYMNEETEDKESEMDKDDSELLVTNETQTYKDPLTQVTMKDPLKCKLCNHAYEKSSILQYLGESKKKCPYVGCQMMIGKRDLVEHFALKVKLSVMEPI